MAFWFIYLNLFEMSDTIAGLSQTDAVSKWEEPHNVYRYEWNVQRRPIVLTELQPLNVAGSLTC